MKSCLGNFVSATLIRKKRSILLFLYSAPCHPPALDKRFEYQYQIPAEKHNFKDTAPRCRYQSKLESEVQKTTAS